MNDITSELRAAASALDHAAAAVRELPIVRMTAPASALTLQAPAVIAALNELAALLDPDCELVDLAAVDALVQESHR